MLPLLREPFADDVTERICHAMKPNTMILNNAGTPLVIKVCNKYVSSGSIFVVVVIEVADDAMGRLSTALDKIEDDATAEAAAVAILFGSNVIIVMTAET